MNSSRPNPIDQPFVNWLELCRRRFPSATVNGSGRWAVTSECGNQGGILTSVGRVTLIDDRETADALVKSPCGSKCCIRIHEVKDLAPTPSVCRTVPDAYDVDEARAERRARRAAQAQGSSVA
jgi:hypothetical protein